MSVLLVLSYYLRLTFQFQALSKLLPFALHFLFSSCLSQHCHFSIVSWTNHILLKSLLKMLTHFSILRFKNSSLFFLVLPTLTSTFLWTINVLVLVTCLSLRKLLTRTHSSTLFISLTTKFTPQLLLNLNLRKLLFLINTTHLAYVLFLCSRLHSFAVFMLQHIAVLVLSFVHLFLAVF